MEKVWIVRYKLKIPRKKKNFLDIISQFWDKKSDLPDITFELWDLNS